MQTLTTQALASLATGNLEILEDCYVIIDITATWGGGTTTMQHSRDKGTTWATFTTDKVDQTFTEDTYQRYALPAGRWFRWLNDATVTLLTVYVSGPRININA